MLVGYARASTRDQEPALQHDALEGAGCEHNFEETASGAQRDRSQLTAALDWMRKSDTLVVWRLDCLARSIRQLIDTVEDLDTRVIGFRSVVDPIDTTTSGGRLVFHIIGALPEFERNLISERTRVGLEAARVRGRSAGRPPALDEGGVVAARSLLRDPSIPAAEVATRLGVSNATLYKYCPGGRGGIDDRARNPAG